MIDLAGEHWRTSSYSGPTGNCVEVADLPGGRHAVRDTKDRGRALCFRSREWRAFVAGVRSGEFDRPAGSPAGCFGPVPSAPERVSGPPEDPGYGPVPAPGADSAIR
ncbi:hypothetical protein BJF78_26450 [Pseudonocardia sp. CNS-139]|nr:hypothetical protein BJF78_26450 [Pseudonocardia sp. CNS-139]